MAQPPFPSATSALRPFLGGRSRRGSLASITSNTGGFDRDVLAQALDNIHTSASKSETLTCFHDYDGGAPRNGAKEIVSSGVSGLYDKIKRGFGGTAAKEDNARPKSGGSKESLETESIRSNLSRKQNGKAVKRPQADAASVVSNSSTVASPMVTSFTSNVVPTEGSRQELKPDAQARAGLQVEDRPELIIDTKSATRDYAPDTNGKRLSYKSPTEDDVKRARSAILEDDRSETANQALARVLSHPDPQLGDRASRSAILEQDGDDDEAVDDLDSIRAHIQSPSTARPAASNELPEASNVDRIDGETASERRSQRPPMVQLGVSHLPGYEGSKASSTDGGDATSQSTSRTTSRKPALEPSPNINSALQRRRTGAKPSAPTNQPLDHVPSHLKRRVISKTFWMKDENAKDCFYCGQSFSTFRRKHHCRTCGQIFDARCTNLVPGRPFGQPGTIRLCIPCEAMIYGSDDDESTVFSDDNSEQNQRSPTTRRVTMEDDDVPGKMDGIDDEDNFAEFTTPTIGIPASRRNREAKRRSAVIEFDATPALARPTSSHSLISLAKRPRSSSHRRHHSRHQVMRGSKASQDDRVPFHPGSVEDREKGTSLPAFHNDNIIDPDLAPFMSDEGSEEDDQPSIFATMGDVNGPSPGERERIGFGGLFTSAVKKGRSRLGTMSGGKATREDDALSQSTKHLPRLSRNRNPSISSMSFGRPSPRRSRSNMLLKPVESTSFERRPESPLVTGGDMKTKLVRSSAMRGRDAPPVELNRASLEHMRRLLAQMLKEGGIPSANAWERALMPILLQCTDDVEPNVDLGDDMDIRHYIKLKKVPGGRPGDTSYVSGVVFSKNIALKSMSRCLSQPRIAIVTFAIEYARHQTHFMSLEPVIAQEHEYLRNLVGRIAALKPQVLLVQRNVSGLAIDLLAKAGITVVFNIKDSVLAAVSRMTQTTIIKSVDKLAIDPSHLGRCESFEVKTFVHESIRKTYVYLSGCPPDLGCTVVLRGADTKTLRKIKRISEFMCYVAYNLKLETSLLRDEFVAIPTATPSQLAPSDSPTRQNAHLEHGTLQDHGESAVDPSIWPNGGDQRPSKYEQMQQHEKSRILSASPFVVFMEPYLLTQLRETEKRLATFKQLRDQYAAADEEGHEDETASRNHFEMVRPEMVHVPASKSQPKAVREYLHAVHEAQLEKTTHTYDTQKKLMEAFMSGAVDPFDPHSHQTICMLHSTISTVNSAPCISPEVLGIGFYAGFNRVLPSFEEDCTLGQYVDDLVSSANSSCKECGKKMYDHHRQYVHGYGTVSISVQRQTAKMRGYPRTILMWATCRICKQETTVTPMSNNTWRYSFAKYLELSFWSSPLQPRAGVCEHDIHKDFLRCFGVDDLVVRVQYDPVEIYDVVVPRATVTWRVESDLTVKNEQFSHFISRLNAFTDSIKKRLDSINVDTLDEKKSAAAQDVLVELRQRAKDDHQELLDKLQRKYSGSRYYELIPLNRALRFMDEKALAWDEAFNDFEEHYFLTETDIRKFATLQLRNMFLESQPATSTVVSDASDDEGYTEKSPLPVPSLKNQLTGHELRSEQAHDVLSSTVEEHRESIADGDDHNAVLGKESEELLGSSLARKVSPRKEQEQAVQREDVKHLDLAISSKSPDDDTADDRQSSLEQWRQDSRPSTGHSQRDEESFATSSKPMSPGLLDRIEQIRSTQGGDLGEQEAPASKIPRPAATKKRETSPMPAPPPLMRAQSSPSSPRHMPKRSADIDLEHSIDAVANSTASQEHHHADKRLRDRLGMTQLANKVSKVTPSLIPRSVPSKSDEAHNTRVSALAKHFEQMSREFEKERLKERRQRDMRSRQARANPLASSRPVVEVYRNATDAVGERAFHHHAKSDHHDMAHSAEHQPTTDDTAQHPPKTSDETQLDQSPDTQPSRPSSRQEPSQAESDTEEGSSETDLEPPHVRSRDISDPTQGVVSSGVLSPFSVPDLELHPDITISEHKKSAWFKLLSDFWSKRSASGWLNLEYPLHANEHVFEDSDIIVREDEPSSVVALSLACADYQAKVRDFRGHPNNHMRQPTQSNSPAANNFVAEDAQQEAIEASLLSTTATHMKYSFAHGSVKASCKIFYAESFDALRRKTGVAERFVESLSRCLKFDSKGGKTKSLFLKTLDGRFIIKSLQEVELKAFTKFAPDYFNFMGHTLFHGVPSVIAKMFGVFQVTIKNPTTGVDFSYYLLVMENLFYERNPTRRFDLKGSMRNRKIESTGQPDEVLLDENLVETIFESPLFVREHARRLLQASVFNDTLWLCKQNVMDYSLMAGFDDVRKELVVGIIDCIRTYTWDKKLESWIKDRGKNKPTITSPKDYRNRFRFSMMNYILQVSSLDTTLLRTSADNTTRHPIAGINSKHKWRHQGLLKRIRNASSMLRIPRRSGRLMVEGAKGRDLCLAFCWIDGRRSRLGTMGIVWA